VCAPGEPSWPRGDRRLGSSARTTSSAAVASAGRLSRRKHLYTLKSVHRAPNIDGISAAGSAARAPAAEVQREPDGLRDGRAGCRARGFGFCSPHACPERRPDGRRALRWPSSRSSRLCPWATLSFKRRCLKLRAAATADSVSEVDGWKLELAFGRDRTPHACVGPCGSSTKVGRELKCRIEEPTSFVVRPLEAWRRAPLPSLAPSPLLGGRSGPTPFAS
jgi:hypothetical protein